MNNLFDLTGNVALITGASSGLGIQFAKALANQGADIALFARREEKLKEVEKEITTMGRKCLAVKCDVTNELEVINSVEKVVSYFGKIDILVNNAGVSANSPAEDLSLEEWNKVVNTNLTGVFITAKHVCPHMKKRNYGRIINTASMYGAVANMMFGASPYHASKAGVVNLTRALAAEWAKYGITVNAIGPGFFDSEMTHNSFKNSSFQNYVKMTTPMGRCGKEGELDGALIYLASQTSSYTTGQTIFVDGGTTAI